MTEARTYAFKKEIDAEATGKRFAGQLEAFRAAPEIYLYEQWITNLIDTLKDIRKYVIVSDKNDKRITLIDLEKKPDSGLLNVQEVLKESSGQ